VSPLHLENEMKRFDTIEAAQAAYDKWAATTKTRWQPEKTPLTAQWGCAEYIQLRGYVITRELAGNGEWVIRSYMWVCEVMCRP